MKILIVEDEAELAADMVGYLSSLNYRCEVAENYARATEKINAYSYDCILLDLMLPDGNGMDLLKVLKEERKHEGVMIISAKNAVEDKVKGLQIGADDYLEKPFHLSELAARIHAIIRRKQFDNANVLVQNELSIDFLSRSVQISEQEVVLTKKEFDLLALFVGNKNRVISKGALAEHLSGDMAEMFDNHDFVYAHVKNLKKKLNAHGYGGYLHTIYGTGYQWKI